MIGKFVFSFIMVFIIESLHAQVYERDFEFIFKSEIYFDMKGSLEQGVKNDSSFILFDRIVDVTLNKIKSDGFSENFIFLSLDLYDLKENRFLENIIYCKDYAYDEDKFVISINKYVERYILCINKSTGKSYRLYGFNGNDFFSFYRDIQDEYYFNNGKKMKYRYFLKFYKVEKIDFNCLYKSLIKAEFTSPCLNRMSDPLIDF